MTTNDIERYVQKRSKRDPEFIQAWENSHSKHEALRQKSNSNNLRMSCAAAIPSTRALNSAT